MTLVKWTKRNGLLLKVLGTKEGRDGASLYLVCKAECPNPAFGTFSVRIEDVVHV
jgi:hypothetical protein